MPLELGRITPQITILPLSWDEKLWNASALILIPYYHEYDGDAFLSQPKGGAVNVHRRL